MKSKKLELKKEVIASLTNDAMANVWGASADIRRQYMTRSITVALSGIICGVILADTLGEAAGGVLISSLGGTAFKFAVNPWFAYLLSPLLLGACVMVATVSGVSDIRRLKIPGHIKEAY